jgi:hypothetical protein
MRLVVVNAYEDRAILAQQFFQQLQARIHHATPFVVARSVFAFLADGLADPFLEPYGSLTFMAVFEIAISLPRSGF